MNAPAMISHAGAPAMALSAGQLKLVKDTVARDCNDQEFSLFCEVARGMGLNPFQKQILPMVFGKNAKDQSKRRMSIIITRDGQRVIASRCRDYRPASEKAEIVIDEALKSRANPKAIVSVAVKLWKQDNAGQWWPVVGEAYWDEFAPLKHSDANYEETGEFWPDGNPKKRLKVGAVPDILDTDGNWGKMPIVMLTKCAEMQALRAGWPEQFSGVYGEEEMARAQSLDIASEIVAKEEEDRRLARLNSEPTVTMCFNAQTAELVHVPVGKVFDRVVDWVKGCDADAVKAFVERNRMGLRQYHAHAPGDALELKKELEKAQASKPLVLEAS